MIEKISLRFGPFAPPLGTQLRDQGVVLPVDDLGHFQADADAITRVKVRGLLPDAQAEKCRIKLLRAIGKAVKAL